MSRVLRPNRDSWARDAGLSLIEVLVALSILSITMIFTGIVAGSFMERERTRDQITSVRALLEAARYEAISTQSVVDFGNFVLEREDSNAASGVTIESNLRVFPTGVCSEGTVTLTTADRMIPFSIRRLDCKMEHEDGSS